MDQEKINISNCNSDEFGMANSANQDIAIRQDTLPDSQQNSTQNVLEDVPQIINRIQSIAREIGWLSERKAPVENDNVNSVSSVVTRL